MSAPVGWTVIKQEPESIASGPSNDDLMAIADAVREVAANHESIESVSQSLTNPEQGALGRRGHLRAVPS